MSSLSSVGLSCQMESSVASNQVVRQSLPYVCDVPEDALAGTNAFSFRAVSTARSDAIHNEAVVYTIDATWDANAGFNHTCDSVIPYLGDPQRRYPTNRKHRHLW